MTVVGFLTHKFTRRGTEIAVYDYADYNETLLGNKSIILTSSFNTVKHEYYVAPDVYEKFEKRFQVVYFDTYNDVHRLVEEHKIEVLYVLKSGRYDQMVSLDPSLSCRLCVHCVFESNCPHGDVYAVIGETINQICGTNYPVVPHMIRTTPEVGNQNFRASLEIPNDAIVFGRYGGRDSFDIRFVKRYIDSCRLPDTYFIFMNTQPFTKNWRAMFFEGTTCPIKKQMFINTCDALLHARIRGETFGLTCGEFCLSDKPVVTYGKSKETTHIDILKDHAIIYNNASDLDLIIRNFRSLQGLRPVRGKDQNPYNDYRPENVMKRFEEIFLYPKDVTRDWTLRPTGCCETGETGCFLPEKGSRNRFLHTTDPEEEAAFAEPFI